MAVSTTSSSSAVCISSSSSAAALINSKYAAYAETEEGTNGTVPCSPILRSFTVQIPQQLANNERVGLTGDSKALGEWKLERCIELSKKNDSLEWYGNVMLPACRNLNYRYFIYAEDRNGLRQIRRWETHLKPRSLETCVTNCRQVDVFGQISSGDIQANRGWIKNEQILQLKFERERMFQVHDIEKFDPENVQIKLVALEADQKTEIDAEKSGLMIEVLKMNYGDSKLKKQSAEGISHKRNDIVIFHVTVPKNLELTYSLQFYTANTHELMGKAIIEPTDIKASSGDLMLKINDTAKTVIARLTLPYLLVKPFSDVDMLDFRTSFAHYWLSWPKLHVGHRGNGKSYIVNPPEERENTISSFLKAYEVFADMIELDVHLTADGIPVIYHDFGVRTAPRDKKVTDITQLEYVLIKDINYEALKNLRVFAIVNNEIKEYPTHNSETIIENRIFPTFQEVLEALPKTLGIDVEIKWPQRKTGGSVEAEQTIDKNFFIDRVLQTLIQHGCGRPLIFSSFDADICTMLRFKQNLIPVMYLSQGETKKWEAFLDLRTRTFEQAINNAQAFELAGTAPHAEDFKGDPGAELMQKAKDMQQIVLVWGDDCNSKEAVKYFETIGATAICYDRSDLYIPEDKDIAFFDNTSMADAFKDQCRS